MMMFDRLPKRWKTDSDHATQRALEWLAEMVAAPISLVMRDGEFHCNAALKRILADEAVADRRQVLDAIGQLALLMSRSGPAARNDGSIDERELRVRTTAQRYVLEPAFGPVEHLLVGVVRVHHSN